MSEFVFLFRSTLEGRRAAMGTPEAAQRSLQAWMTWIGNLEKNGHLKNRGAPLDGSGSVVRSNMVTDGPFLEAKEIVLGFIVVEARDMQEAIKLASDNPMVLGGGALEIRPVVSLGV